MNYCKCKVLTFNVIFDQTLLKLQFADDLLKYRTYIVTREAATNSTHFVHIVDPWVAAIQSQQRDVEVYKKRLFHFETNTREDMRQNLFLLKWEMWKMMKVTCFLWLL